MDQVATDLCVRKAHPRIGLLPTGHAIYWDQFPGLRERGLGMYERYRDRLGQIGEVVSPGLVDTPEKAAEAGALFAAQKIDILLVLPLGYTTGLVVLPAVRALDEHVPLRILNTHLDASYDYKTADTATYLYHEGPCCIPEYAAGLVSVGRAFRVRSGHFASRPFWEQVTADCAGAAAARAFRGLNMGLLGNTYTGMVDMPIDEQRWLRASGRMIVRPEVEEIEEAYHAVTEAQVRQMYAEFRRLYDVDATVTDAHMLFSARAAVAYEQVILRHDIAAFGYYWWGQKDLITQLRAQSNLAVSRLAALGRPGVTEGDLKTAMAMKILDLLGAGGMFVEFFAVDYAADFLLMGHDGPSNINMAAARPRLQHLDVHHGKTGHGLGIDFEVRQGPATLLNISQCGGGPTFKLICVPARVIGGEVLQIGNPNCRVQVERPLAEFFDAWCQQGPTHHTALGAGDHLAELETFAQAMGFDFVRI
jgi:L-arabinose isomerase